MNEIIKRQSCHHIETSQLICRANQWTCFYIIANLAFSEWTFTKWTIKKFSWIVLICFCQIFLIKNCFGQSDWLIFSIAVLSHFVFGKRFLQNHFYLINDFFPAWEKPKQCLYLLEQYIHIWRKFLTDKRIYCLYSSAIYFIKSKWKIPNFRDHPLSTS